MGRGKQVSFLFEEMNPQDEFQPPPYDTDRINISFSGGQTSGKMCHQIVKQFGDTHEIVITFANTGQEAEETLQFVHQCETHFGWNVVWLEAVVDPERGKGTKHRVVDYYTASRNGEPFEEVIKKYGLPNQSYPHCTRELKIQVMQSYLKSIGWDWGTYTTCIGIRSDEMDRMNAKRKEYKFWYPMVNANWTRKAVDDWWDEQPFKLGIPNYLGNCTWCYKKTFKKLKRIAGERPGVFDFPKRMEELYSNCGSGDERQLFRKYTTTVQLLADAKNEREGDEMADGCDTGCEVFGQYFDASELKDEEIK